MTYIRFNYKYSEKEGIEERLFVKSKVDEEL